MILFDHAYEKGNLTSAKAYLKIFKDKAPSYFKPLVNYAEGKIHEEEGKVSKAFNAYESIVKKIRRLDLYLYLDLARLSKELGRPQDAKRYYQAVITEFPESEFSPLVKYELWTLR